MQFAKLGGVVVTVVIILLLLHALYEANVNNQTAHTMHSPKKLPLSHSRKQHQPEQHKHLSLIHI